MVYNGDMSVGVRLPFVHPAAPKDEDRRDRNDKLHKFMLDGINKYLGIAFTEENMELIYTYLGNDCNRPLCREFIRSGYVFDLLYDYAEKGRGGGSMSIAVMISVPMGRGEMHKL